MTRRTIVIHEVVMPRREASRAPNLPQVANPIACMAWYSRVVIWPTERPAEGAVLQRSFVRSRPCRKRTCGREALSAPVDLHKADLSPYGCTDYAFVWLVVHTEGRESH